MTQEHRDQQWLQDFLTKGPGEPEWPALSAELNKRLPRLDVEDQVKAAERLAGLAGAEGVKDLIAEVYARAEVSLPALLVLARGRESEAELAAELEQWVVVRENGGGECASEDYFRLPAKARKAVADHLALWLRTDVLLRLKEAAPDKAAAKELAKALHRAKSAGASVAEPGGTRYVMAERDEYADEAYLTPTDGSGTFFLYLYRTIFGKNSLAVVLVNDREGVIRFDAYQLNRSRLERMLEAARSNPQTVLVKIDPRYARRLIRRAEAAGIKRGVSQNENYLGNRRALGVADEPDAPHPIWNKLDPEQLRAERGLAFTSGELIGHRIFEDWLLESLESDTLINKLAEYEYSPLELTPAQKKEREDELFRKEVVTIIEDAGREVWRERLLMSAYALLLLGEEQQARTAAAVALAIERTDEPAPTFFLELLRRTVAREAAEDNKGPAGPDVDQGGLIV
jgi:hypothetical protein